MRILLTATAALFATAPALASKPAPDTLAGGPVETAQDAPADLFVEKNTYRYAQPYRSERGTSAEACEHICSTDTACAAWTLTPASFETGPRCELKRTPGKTSYLPGAVSGLSAKLLMDPARDAVMRYQVAVPEGYQPAAVPLDQLEPSPTPRVVGDPLVMSEPELLGETEPKVIPVKVAKAPPPLPPAPAPVVEAAPVVIEAARPSPKPVNLAEIAATPLVEENVGAPVKLAAPAPVPTPEPVIRVSTVKALPAIPIAQLTPAPAPVAPVSMVNAVLKPAVAAPAPAPAPVAAPAPKPVSAKNPKAAPTPAKPEAPGAPIVFRTPWVNRNANDPAYSVSDGETVPGDEDVAAGLTDAGS